MKEIVLKTEETKCVFCTLFKTKINFMDLRVLLPEVILSQHSKEKIKVEGSVFQR